VNARTIATIVTIAAAPAAAMVFAGCFGKGEQPRPATQPTAYRRAWSDDDVVKPEWLKDATLGGRHVGAYGSTAHDPYVDTATMRDRAVDSARRELSRMVEVKVQSVLMDYVGESQGSVTTFTQSVGRSIASQSISGSVQRDEWRHPKTRELFVWVVVDPAYSAKLAQNVAGAAREAAAKDPALSAHLRAKAESDKGFAELDRLLDKSFQGP
jgi:hypothetical protein